MINVILQFLELDLVNINMSAKFYQNIPNGLRVNFHFFQNLNLGQNLDQSQILFDYPMGYIMSISMLTQKFIEILHSVQEIRLFSLVQNLTLGKASTNDKCHFAISWTRCSQYQCGCKFYQNIQNGLRVIVFFDKQAGDKIFTNCPVTKSNV